MSTGILKVSGDKVVGEDAVFHTAVLTTAHYFSMENFITGYPGHESEHRASMLKVLGQEKYDFFFDKWLEYFFTAADAAFFASKGLNCLRLPFNYHHFEDDMRPRELKLSGFKHLDRVIDICAAHGIYTILDMHTVPGGQNGDWHSDNASTRAAFWDHRDHQDRTVWLWERIADRYRGNAWVAGYNPINEPCDPEHVRLPRFYERIEKAIRKVDPDHILWLDGNTFAMEWKGFDEALPNSVYALHDYTTMGFPKGEVFRGSEEQKQKLERQFCRKAEIMYRLKTPIWNGEFGPVYANPLLDPDHVEVNKARFGVLDEQLSIYDKYQIHWSIWLYKDIGVQGMVHVNPESKWMRTIAPFLEKKRALQLDAWGRYPSKQVEEVIYPLAEWIDRVAPNSKDQYPTPWATERQITRLINQIYLSKCFSDEFAEQFRDMTHQELEACARSFHFDECAQRQGLNEALEAHADVAALPTESVRPTNVWLDSELQPRGQDRSSGHESLGV
ncbi:hypothetical protein MBLNU459_g5090t1 [Dothideomycetes sp. NU459]